MRLIARSLSTLLFAGVALAGDPAPLGPELVVNETLGYQQEWGKVAMSQDGTRLAVAWSSVLGNEVWIRFYDGDGTPRGPEQQVNTVLIDGVQDEPMVAMDDAGNVLVCWSDRNDYDGGAMGTGEKMGCFGRIFGPDDLPLGPEIQLNQKVAKSQWEPHPNALPGGGWSVSFNGDSDGDAYLTFFDTDGTPRGPDAQVNTFDSNGQTEAEHALTRDGQLLYVFADFSGHGAGGTGTNLWARLYDETGAALQTEEFLVNENTLDFDQLEPRMAAAGIDYGFGGFIIVWEDWGNDGSSAGIYARLYDRDAQPLGPEFRVNGSAAGTQRLPEVAADYLGNFCVTWQDDSQGDWRIMARHFDRSGKPEGNQFEVSEGYPGDYLRPQVALDASGELFAFTYSGPGKSGPGNNGEDVYLRLFERPAITPLGTPEIGGIHGWLLDLPGGEDQFYILAAAFSAGTGLALPDGRVLPVDFDALFRFSLNNPDGAPSPFEGFQGVLGTSELGLASVTLPSNPLLIGLPIHVAAATFDLEFAALKFQLRHVTRSRSVIIE
ncbi:MAG: hypothetical protein DHS20C15_07990 [Planctomycetota bacterium]|nr:MAG: hypothetical protein DHS20C15_07990 [Planctomycetota bacterium]